MTRQMKSAVSLIEVLSKAEASLQAEVALLHAEAERRECDFIHDTNMLRDRIMELESKLRKQAA